MKTLSVPINDTGNLDEIKTRIKLRKPFLIRNYDIGPCKELWTHEYVSNKVGETPVKIHVSTVGSMDFVSKNFLYKTLPFNELVRRTASDSFKGEHFLQPGEYYYLRSLGSDPRGREVANLSKHYPDLAKDFKVPPFFEEKDFFSSVFRVSSAGLRLWTHYDIMDNILIQVQGSKEVTLWSPEEAENLYLIGDKSCVIDVDNPDVEKFPKFLNATSYKCVLSPGDIIFIPAMWFHNTFSTCPGIAVNVFWKNLDHDLYDKKDPYGNKDLIPGSRALQSLENAMKALEILPNDYQEFYIRRMREILRRKLACQET